MTPLSQTCTDMLAAQGQLQRLNSLERARLAGHIKTLPGMVEGLRQAQAVQLNELARCGVILASGFPAANDPAPPEGRAA